MTDEEIKHLLRPRHNWTAILAAAAAVGGVAWGVAHWAATVPTGDQFREEHERGWRLETQIGGVKQDVGQIKTDMGNLNPNMNEIRVNLTQLKERRGR